MHFRFKMDSTSKSFGWFFILSSISAVCGLLYVDNLVYDSDDSVAVFNISYTHDATGNSVTSGTYTTFVTITKMLLYFKVWIAEDQKNQGRELMNTVVDMGKVFQGFQANPLIRGFFSFMVQNMNFTMKFPMPPVSRPSLQST